MAMNVKGRIGIVKWMATTKDDGKWDRREVDMATLAAKRKRGEGYTKSGATALSGIYNDPAAKFTRGAKEHLFTVLTEELGVDPAKLTGADKTKGLKDFEKLTRAGRLAFLTGNADVKSEHLGDIYDVRQVAVRDRMMGKWDATFEFADNRLRENWAEYFDPDLTDYSFEAGLEDDHAGMWIDTLKKGDETFGYAITHTYNQGEEGFSHYFDHRGQYLGERDAGV